MVNKFYIISGGTICPIAPHSAFTAQARGRTGAHLAPRLQRTLGPSGDVVLLRTDQALGDREHSAVQRKILDEAGVCSITTNDDLYQVVDYLTTRKDTKCIIMTCAVCDMEPESAVVNGNVVTEFGEHVDRIKSRDLKMDIRVKPADKIVQIVRQERKDIFLVAFKATSNERKEETYRQGLKLLKESSANIVFANDLQEDNHLIVVPEEYYYERETRKGTLELLCEMIKERSNLSYVKTMVKDKNNIPFDVVEEHAPENFLSALTHVVARGAFRDFNGSTTGHFGCRLKRPVVLNGHTIHSFVSARKVDHNNVFLDGMIGVLGYKNKTELHTVGGKPSAGEHTQQSIFHALRGKVHSVIHVHCPIKTDLIPSVSQFPYECGSLECARNTAEAIREIKPGIFAVHLAGHGPNVAFHRDVPSEDIIEFIETHVDLDSKTGGFIPDAPKVPVCKAKPEKKQKTDGEQSESKLGYVLPEGGLRGSTVLEVNGESKTLLEWSKKIGVSVQTLTYRIRNRFSSEELLRPTKGRASYRKRKLTFQGHPITVKKISELSGYSVPAVYVKVRDGQSAGQIIKSGQERTAS